MSLRTYLQNLDRRGDLLHVTEPISTTHQIAATMKGVEPHKAFLELMAEFEFYSQMKFALANLFAKM